MYRKAYVLVLSLCLLFGVFGGTAMADPSGAEAEAIEHLIDYIGQSHQIFIRNGEEHDAEAAAAHVREKYTRYKPQIRTAEDFIERAASKSLITGKPYLVKMSDGTQIEINSWLTSELKKYREGEVRKN